MQGLKAGGWSLTRREGHDLAVEHRLNAFATVVLFFLQRLSCCEMMVRSVSACSSLLQGRKRRGRPGGGGCRQAPLPGGGGTGPEDG